MIDNIKSIISDNLGNHVKITYNEGRNRVFVYRGKVVEVYNNIFIIFDDNNSCKRCFSYYDVLTDMVRISFK